MFPFHYLNQFTCVHQPYAMDIAAQHLTVGGLLEFDILLASVPTAVQIISVSATLLARYTLRSIQRSNAEPQYTSRRTRLFIFDAKNPPCSDAKVLALNVEGIVTPFTSSSLPPASPVDESCAVLNSNGVPVGTKRKSVPRPTTPVEAPLSIVEAGGSYQVRALIGFIIITVFLRPAFVPSLHFVNIGQPHSKATKRRCHSSVNARRHKDAHPNKT